MPKAFDFSNPPFDRLLEAELAMVKKALDIQFFNSGETILNGGDAPDTLYVVLKGFVEERDGDEVVAIYGSEDLFDSRALIDGSVRHSFVVREEAICYLLPKTVVLELTRANPAFGAYFYQNISEKLDSLATRQSTQELHSLMMARVRQAYLQPPLYINATASIYDAAVLMKSQKAASLLVRAGDEAGIVTGIDMYEAVILEGKSSDTPVGAVATFDLVTVAPDDFLFNALILMTKHAIRRIVVHDGAEIVGVLDEIDLLSFLSNHSHIIAVQVARAETKQELKKASQNVLRLIEVLNSNGVKIQFITRLVNELNSKIFEKLFQMISSPEMQANSCLIVMGSEGRGEQIMKTDQDNALILRDGYEPAELDRFRAEFTEALLDFGYPSCPGDIMLRNPEWSKPLSAYRDDLHKWILTPDEYAPLRLAIFYDAAAIAGDKALLTEAKEYMFKLLGGNDAFYNRFARAIDAFETPLGMFFNLVTEKGRKGDALDIKKGGVFPIVHGVRSLALQRKLTETNTIERIRRLQELGQFDRAFANELIESFAFLVSLRLKGRLSQMSVGEPVDNLIRLDELSALERDVLKDALFAVKKFKEFVRYHFKLSVF